MIEDSGIQTKILKTTKHLVPKSLFDSLKPIYHSLISSFGAWYYGYPSRKLKVIAITGTKGKSTTTFMLAHVLRSLGEPVASVGSLGYSIKERSWPNTLKMTMPGRTKLHAFMRQAVDAGCDWCVLETTSEGIAQSRLNGIQVDCAVMTNLHPEHIESHGSMENYKKAKLKLFAIAKGVHVLNYEDRYFTDFAVFNPKKQITYGRDTGMITLNDVPNLKLKIAGDFNLSNALAVITTAISYGFDKNKVVEALNSIDEISGRMQVIKLKSGALAIVDYAHTPDSLQAVYRNARRMITNGGKLIAILGSAGGGRDVWKRPVFGKIAQQNADEIILTNEDPYDEDPEKILDQIKSGFVDNIKVHCHTILDRKEAIEKACQSAVNGDVVVITGKGSEVSMALADGKKISWSDAEIVKSLAKI